MTEKYSVDDLATNAVAAIDYTNLFKEPVAIMRGGRAVAVLLDFETYVNDKQALDEFTRIYRDEAGIRPARKVEEIAEDAKAQQEQEKPTHAWRCTICGYTVETDGELPDGFTCPKCGVGKDLFERIDL